jgi:hypothetical protein
VPNNEFGHQTPHSGHGYGGGYAYLENGELHYREYLETQLLSPLVAGRTYQVSFYANLADASQYALDALGAYLSVNPVLHPLDSNPLAITPSIQSPPGHFLSSTTDWTLVQGTFVAAGGEDYITIGNFNDDPGTATQNTGPSSGFIYYYIDDVSVVDVTPQCPPNIMVTSCTNVPVFYNITATDNNCPNATVTCSPESGSTFPPGTTTIVHCTATDCCNNSTNCDFSVTVICPPNPCLQIQCPDDIVVMSCSDLPVSYAATVTDTCTGNYHVTYNPPSGSSFTLGTKTTVSCIATDDLGNIAACGFSVTVSKPKLTFIKVGNTITISWAGGGKLQQADDLNGSWTDVPGGSISPCIIQINPLSPQKFYRLKCD